MNDALSPLERRGVLVVGRDEAIDGGAQLRHRGKTRALQGAAAQNAEPALDLIQPAGVRRRVVKMHARVAGQPAIVFRLVRAEVVQHDM